MAGVFAQPNMKPDEFKIAFETTVLTRYHGAWTLFADTANGFIPVGFVLAFHSHTEHAFSPFMIVGDLVWCPWSSGRNKIESAVNFFNSIITWVPLRLFIV